MDKITLFSTLAVRKPLEETILPAFAALTGIEVRPVFDPTTQLFRRIESREPFDVIIGVADSLVTLAGQGAIKPSTVVKVASTQVGLAVPPGTEIPDISDPARFLDLLLSARSVAYSRTGASGRYFAKLIATLGIAEEIDQRSTIIEKGFTADALIDGRADIAVQQLSELRFVPDARVAGPFPRPFQHVTPFSAALNSSTDLAAEAHTLLQHLTTPFARGAYETASLHPADAVPDR